MTDVNLRLQTVIKNRVLDVRKHGPVAKAIAGIEGVTLISYPGHFVIEYNRNATRANQTDIINNIRMVLCKHDSITMDECVDKFPIYNRLSFNVVPDQDAKRRLRAYPDFNVMMFISDIRDEFERYPIREVWGETLSGKFKDTGKNNVEPESTYNQAASRIASAVFISLKDGVIGSPIINFNVTWKVVVYNDVTGTLFTRSATWVASFDVVEHCVTQDSIIPENIQAELFLNRYRNININDVSLELISIFGAIASSEATKAFIDNGNKFDNGDDPSVFTPKQVRLPVVQHGLFSRTEFFEQCWRQKPVQSVSSNGSPRKLKKSKQSRFGNTMKVSYWNTLKDSRGVFEVPATYPDAIRELICHKLAAITGDPVKSIDPRHIKIVPFKEEFKSPKPVDVQESTTQSSVAEQPTVIEESFTPAETEAFIQGEPLNLGNDTDPTESLAEVGHDGAEYAQF